ncbi:hypothetical protein [Variovorax sp. W6]|uniref:hypothetical protein n=1 Tax=Variovorax sp. W6 TaxID=3093895 RepID=UPI003D805822
MTTAKTKYLSSFAVTHATVLALVVGVFLMDGCAHRQTQAGAGATNAHVAPAPAAREPRP